MNYNVLILPAFILICAIAPSTLTLGEVASKPSTLMVKTETKLLNNNRAPKICADKDGNYYDCP